ncbi:MAG: sulfatase-like hydrolase/transferase [Pseudomonadota bacterium]|jgi:arylsulfatase A-like enzyme
MAKPKNILFIMCDQLRADYLSCYGHKTLATPHIDGIAKRGVKFDRAYCQSPNCGPSRASFYSGRYVFSHGATWNFIPLPLGEQTMGDHLRASGMRVAVVGKTHMYADRDGLTRMLLPTDSAQGKYVAEAGFEPYERDDGIHPDSKVDPKLAYNEYLRSHGMTGDNPWHTWANAGVDAQGQIASGWYYRNAHLPTRVPDEHSETAYMTHRAMDFMTEQGDKPWMLHLSYIKPHWPYIAQAPYHKLYGADDVQAPIRAAHERDNDHPVYAGFRQHPEGRAFSRDADRLNVIPAYMGLVKQVDDYLGQLFAFMQARGLMDNTLIVFTADHSDYLGDHWLGEKEFMFEQGVRIPMIIADPSAPQTHGTTSQALVEAIDLLPTFLESQGLPVPWHWLEGKSLQPLLKGEKTSVREVAISELDYAIYGAARNLKLQPNKARMVMARSERFKYIHYDGFPAQLFDMQQDPQELHDLGRDPGYSTVRDEHLGWIFDWMRSRRNRVTISDEDIMRRANPAAAGGVIIGEW